MKGAFWLCGLMALVMHAVPSLAQAAPGRKVALIVGHNLGLPGEVPLRYAHDDAKKLAKVLTDLGGYQPADVRLLVAPTGKEFEEALRGIAAATEVEEVLFYYSGHGDGRYLHLGDERILVADIKRRLERRQDVLRLIIVDTCQSGEATRLKGVSVAPPFDVALQQGGEASGTIIITSSSLTEASQESDRLAGSVFSHHWVTGLYGAADHDRDGLVTLEEAYRYAHFKTVDGTIGSRAGLQNPTFRFSVVGVGGIVMTNLAPSTAHIVVLPGATQGAYFVVDPDKRLVFTEIPRHDDGTWSVRLPPGRYRVRKREVARIRELDVTVAEHGRVEITDAQMRVTGYERPVAKGGRQALFNLDAHGPLMAMGVREPITPRHDNEVQLALGYHLQWDQLFVRPQLRWGRSRETLVAGADVATRAVDAYAAGGALGWYLRRGDRRISVGAEAWGLAFRDDPDVIVPQGAPRGVLPLGGELGGFLELDLRVGQGVHLLASGRLSAQAVSIDDEFTVLARGGLMIGVAVLSLP